jgi:hypothetical protein
MFIALFTFLKDRFSKESITEAKSNKSKMSRQEAFKQMRNIASKRKDS